METFFFKFKSKDVDGCISPDHKRLKSVSVITSLYLGLGFVTLINKNYINRKVGKVLDFIWCNY